jgi:hypothetical protein
MHYDRPAGPLFRKGLPLGPGGRAALCESLAIDEVVWGIEMVLQAGVDRGRIFAMTSFLEAEHGPLAPAQGV